MQNMKSSDYFGQLRYNPDIKYTNVSCEVIGFALCLIKIVHILAVTQPVQKGAGEMLQDEDTPAVR